MASINVNFDENTVDKLVDEHLIVKNAELKQLLRLALTDFEDLLSREESECYFCGSESCLNTKRCEPKWRYAAEAEKLLGGGEE